MGDKEKTVRNTEEVDDARKVIRAERFDDGSELRHFADGSILLIEACSPYCSEKDLPQ